MAIERKFVQQNLKEFQIKEHVFSSLGKVGVAELKLQRTPLGEKILIRCSRPGLVVGRGGQNIQRLTRELKEEFKLENPQIEIEEVSQPMLEPAILAEMISNSLERFGPGRFKGIGHKALNEAMRAGALGVEILISGKIPSQRAKTWRFYAGYLKKCGDIATEGVNVSYRIARMKLGVVGIKVSVVPPTTVLPDRIDIHEPSIQEVTGKPVAQQVEEAVAETAGAADASEKKSSDREASDDQPEKAPGEATPHTAAARGVPEEGVSEQDQAQEDSDTPVKKAKAAKKTVKKTVKKTKTTKKTKKKKTVKKPAVGEKETKTETAEDTKGSEGSEGSEGSGADT